MSGVNDSQLYGLWREKPAPWEVLQPQWLTGGPHGQVWKTKSETVVAFLSTWFYPEALGRHVHLLSYPESLGQGIGILRGEREIGREKENAFHRPCSLIPLLPAWHIFNKGTGCLYIHTLLFSLYGQSLIPNQQPGLSDALNIRNTRGQARYPWLVHKHAERGSVFDTFLANRRCCIVHPL